MSRIFSQASKENYIEIDHRAGDGITPEQAASGPAGTIPVGRGMRFQSATINCSHCKSEVVLNPLRTRSRGYCPKCDHYVCDGCEAIRAATGGECFPFSKVLDDFMDAAAKGHDVKPITDAFMKRREQSLLIQSTR